MMNNFIGRNAELKNKFNKHLKKLTGIDSDFYSALKEDDIIELKTVLSDINNLLTFKLTLTAGNWICKYFSLSQKNRKVILDKIDSTKPNEQGFDIIIHEPIKLIAEVKCNAPVKLGSKFGAMQSKKLLEDAQKLLKGKRQLSETKEYLKFLFVIDLGDRSHKAIANVIKKTNFRKENEERLNRNIVREQIIVLNDSTKVKKLDTDKVYIKVIKLE